MKKFLTLIAIGTLLLQTACSTHTAMISYSEFKGDMAVKADAWNGENLGSVSGEDGGAIWDNCTEKARGSVREMIFTARARGANAVGDVRWAANGSSEPTCKKGWGYFVLWPFILTPLFMSTKVMGNAYKVKGNPVADGLFLLPNDATQDAELAAKIASTLE